jgi:acetyl/propionyl-CoA carboxylase alpha subunit
MSTKFENINEAMELAGIPGLNENAPFEVDIIEPIVLKEIESNLDLVSEDFRTDYELVRQSYHYQQQMILDAAQVALQNAKENDSPRSMEVFSTLMSMWSSTNKELLKMHREIKEIQKRQDAELSNTNVNNTQTNNNIMIGTPADLLQEFGSQFDQSIKEQDLIEN